MLEAKSGDDPLHIPFQQKKKRDKIENIVNLVVTLWSQSVCKELKTTVLINFVSS